MLRRTCDITLALILLTLAWPALGHALGPAAAWTLSEALHTAGNHLRALLGAAAAVVALRALPHPSRWLLEALFGAFVARVVLHRTAAA